MKCNIFQNKPPMYGRKILLPNCPQTHSHARTLTHSLTHPSTHVHTYTHTHVHTHTHTHHTHNMLTPYTQHTQTHHTHNIHRHTIHTTYIHNMYCPYETVFSYFYYAHFYLNLYHFGNQCSVGRITPFLLRWGPKARSHHI